MTSPRPEHDVLRTVARQKLDAGSETQLRNLLRQQIDWQYLLATAQEHGLLPLLHKHLSATAREQVPQTFLTAVKKESLANSQSVLHLTGSLLKVQHVLADNGIRVAVFKGPVLAQMAYGDIGLRRAGDIDVLITRDDFAKTKELLESLGYQMVPALTAEQLQSHLGFHCEIQFVLDDGFTIVDLHWGLAPNSFAFRLSTADVLARPQSVSMVGTQLSTLSTEDLILYLSMHGAKHLWRRFEWISSLSEVVRRASVDWQVLLERAAGAHSSRMLALGLHLVRKSSDANVPAHVLSHLDVHRSMEKLATYILENVFFDFTHEEDSIKTSLYSLKVMDRKRDALLSILRAIYTPTLSDFEAITLPSSLHSLYYLLRPLRLSKTYGTSVLRKLAANQNREQ